MMIMRMMTTMKMVVKINCGSTSLESLINCSKMTTHICITTTHYVCDNNVTVCDNNVTIMLGKSVW